MWRFDLSKVDSGKSVEGGGRTLGACLPTEGGGGRGEGRKEEERWKESPVTCTASRDVRSVGRVLDGACPRLLISSTVAKILERFDSSLLVETGLLNTNIR